MPHLATMTANIAVIEKQSRKNIRPAVNAVFPWSPTQM
jgi:transcriptional regulator